MTAHATKTKAALWAIVTPGICVPEYLAPEIRTLAKAMVVRDAVKTEPGRERAFVCLAVEADILARKWASRG